MQYQGMGRGETEMSGTNHVDETAPSRVPSLSTIFSSGASKQQLPTPRLEVDVDRVSWRLERLSMEDEQR